MYNVTQVLQAYSTVTWKSVYCFRYPRAPYNLYCESLKKVADSELSLGTSKNGYRT